jgi:hypothetical protein
MLQRRNGARERRRGEERSTDNHLLHRKDAAVAEGWIGSATAVGSIVGTVMKLSPQPPGLTPLRGSLISQGVNAARRICAIA